MWRSLPSYHFSITVSTYRRLGWVDIENNWMSIFPISFLSLSAQHPSSPRNTSAITKCSAIRYRKPTCHCRQPTFCRRTICWYTARQIRSYISNTWCDWQSRWYRRVSFFDIRWVDEEFDIMCVCVGSLTDCIWLWFSDLFSPFSSNRCTPTKIMSWTASSITYTRQLNRFLTTALAAWTPKRRGRIRYLRCLLIAIELVTVWESVRTWLRSEMSLTLSPTIPCSQRQKVIRAMKNTK